MPRAAIDIGSNSLLLKVVGDGGEVLHDTSVVVGLGRGLGDRGLFQPERMEEATNVLIDFATMAKRLGVPPQDVLCAATSGARRALNADTFFQKVKQLTGLSIRTVPGEEEARLTWAGALFDLELPDGPVCVADLGGGSTELALGTPSEVLLQVSLEMGAVRLTEAFLGTGKTKPSDLGRMQDHIRALLAEVSWPRLPRLLVAVGGTATTLAAMHHELEAYDAARVHGTVLTRADLRSWIDRLLLASPEERQAMAAVAPKRADVLLAGAVVLDLTLDATRRSTLTVSTGGIREGLLATAR